MHCRVPTTAASRTAMSSETAAGEGEALICRLPLLQLAVGGQGQELHEFFRDDQSVQDLRGFAEVTRPRATQLRKLLAPDLLVERRLRHPAVGEPRMVVDPLPELRPRDLGRRD